jgi:glycosyltransferase EpsF
MARCWRSDIVLRVLHVITHLNRGGVEIWLLSMLKHTPRAHCEMDVCCKGLSVGSLAPVARSLGAEVIHCPLHLTQVTFVKRLARIALEGNYNIIHNHLEAYSGLATIAAQLAGVKVITSFHNTHFAPQTTWTNRVGVRQIRSIYSLLNIHYATRSSDLITGCSDAVVELFARSPRVTAKSRRLNYGVDLPELASEVDRVAFRASLGWASNAFIIAHVGRFNAQKNHYGLLNIFESVALEFPEARLVVVGDGPLRDEVVRRIQTSTVLSADRVRLLGTRDDIPKLLTHCDAFLFPSLHEGFGLAALEAQAAGLPVIGSRIPGLTEAVADGESGLLCGLDDLAGFTSALRSLLADRTLAQAMGRRGRHRVATQFSQRQASSELTALYQECLDDAPRSTHRSAPQ